MATSTQYNPNQEFNDTLAAHGLSKTVYALITPEIQKLYHVKSANPELHQEAWTGKQDAVHWEFFDKWLKFSETLVDLNPKYYPFQYPCAGSSEAIRQLIFDNAVVSNARAIHVFEGEYEGYKAMAEAARANFIVHKRDEWREVRAKIAKGDLFFISAPSAIDGNVWPMLNQFLNMMPIESVVLDLTYVGLTTTAFEKINANASSIFAATFSLSKPFGVYYERVGGVFCRKESLSLFGNRWFKNLTSLTFGSAILDRFKDPIRPELSELQTSLAAERVSEAIGVEFKPSDVGILMYAPEPHIPTPLQRYLSRAGTLRVCITPMLWKHITR